MRQYTRVLSLEEFDRLSSEEKLKYVDDMIDALSASHGDRADAAPDQTQAGKDEPPPE